MDHRLGPYGLTAREVWAAEHAWLPFEAALERVHYRGRRDGLRSVHEYVTAPERPAPELRLR